MTLADDLSRYISSRDPKAVISNFSFLVSGFESEIYTFDLQRSNSSPKSYVLRLFTGDGAAEKLAREAKALFLLQKGGYPVPALLWQETEPEILGKPFEIIEKLEARALWPVLASAESQQIGPLLSRFGTLLAQLHQLDWGSFTENTDVYESHPERLLDEIISQYRFLYTKYDLQGFLQVVDWLDTHKKEIFAQPAVVHQDFHANNVLLGSEDQLWVIDWTQFAVSDYRIDLAWTLMIMGDLGNPDWKNQILDAYVSASNRSLEHLDYFHVIVSMKLLASTVIAFTFSPENVGLRSETLQLTKEQVSVFQQLSQQIQTITGVKVPELENLLAST